MVVAIGTTTRDPDVPDGEKPVPVPLQAVALALVQVSVVDSGYHNEIGDAERVTVGPATLTCAELGDKMTACPRTTSAEKSNVIRSIRLYLQQLELDLTRSFWR